MTKYVEDAIKRIKQAPEVQQELVAHVIMETLDAEAEWERLFADPRSETALADLLKEAREEIVKGVVTDSDPADLPLK